MSAAVRVSVWVLGLLVVLSAGVAVLALMQKQTLQGKNQTLQSQITDDQSRIADITSQTKKLQDDADQLNSKINQALQDKSQIQSQYDDLKKKSDDLQNQMTQVQSDRDGWKNRAQTIARQRDILIRKFRDFSGPRIVYRDRFVPAPTATTATPAAAEGTSNTEGDQYWAGILKQKASLQVELEKDRSELDQAALQVVDLKKQNSDLQLQLKEVSNDKDEIVQRIKYGQDLADNLSIDLARARNDQQAVNDRADKLKEENLALLSQIRDLSASKLELEQTVARLTDDKDSMQKKLIETESVIQSRIDDIWKIKQGLDQKLAENAPNAPSESSNPPAPSSTSSSSSMELPPIVVNASNASNNNGSQAAPVNTSSAMPAPPMSSKTQGQIISINESNNFVIVDLGQDNSNVTIGTALKVYRDSTPIASLEIIQVRRDICAADIKDKSVELKVGDVVKFN